jgi:hypothetical protein
MSVAGFMGMGVSILAFSAADHLLLRRSLAKTLATSLLVLAGVFMVVVGFFPCDAGCVDVTQPSRLHSIFSMPGAIGLPGAGNDLGPGVQARREVQHRLAGQLVLARARQPRVGPIIAAELVEGVNGLLQRAAMWTALAWMMAVSIKLYSLARTRSEPNRRPAGQASDPQRGG